MLQSRQPKASVSSRESSNFAASMYCSKENAATLDESVVTLLNESSAFATQNIFCTLKIADGRMTIFFNVCLALNWTIPKTS